MTYFENIRLIVQFHDESDGVVAYLAGVVWDVVPGGLTTHAVRLARHTTTSEPPTLPAPRRIPLPPTLRTRMIV